MFGLEPEEESGVSGDMGTFLPRGSYVVPSVDDKCHDYHSRTHGEVVAEGLCFR